MDVQTRQRIKRELERWQLSVQLFLKHAAVTSNLVSRAFSVSVSTVWNSLKPDLRSVDSLGSFKTQLKSRLSHTTYDSLTQHGPEPPNASDSQPTYDLSAL